jgi:hypothetical protein
MESPKRWLDVGFSALKKDDEASESAGFGG